MNRIFLVFLCLIVIGTAFAACKAKPADEATTESSSVTQQTTALPATTAQDTTAAEEDTETADTSTEKAADVSFLKKGCWYYYNDAELCAFAFTFDGKGGVSLAYFDPANVTGEDPQYFEGGAKYTVEGNTLVISSLPTALALNEFVFDVTKDGLSCQGIALEQQDKLTLDYPYQHFNP